MSSVDDIRRVVVVHRGARDGYQVAAALANAGLLERLVTDLYSGGDRSGTCFLPASIQRGLAKRSHPSVPSSLVRQAPASGLMSFALEKLTALPFWLRRYAVRSTDATLGRVAGRLAASTNSLLLSYSYYGYNAFRSYGRPGMLFQLHPHPVSVRRILQQELADHPECADSLRKEWELSLSGRDFDHLIAETRMAKWLLAASSFTRQTLIENGASPELVHVIPYGVDLKQFVPPENSRRMSGPLRLLFVGTITQRKGIKYLLDALRLLGPAPVELMVCGRPVDDLAIFRGYDKQVNIRPSVSFSELLAAYQAADLFVLPSVAEGFGHVLLEALASGLPILSTTHTAAPDLIREGQEGFLAEPRRPDLLAARIDWALQHRQQLNEMQAAARARAEHFTWEKFRQEIVKSVRGFLYCYGQF